ncbi:amino acid transporter [Aspergillus homomorphus CBS 101889]|uniref:Amino acid transporter n=1 Tax=Aspergillus homomorphus (strain CBS 101889) TaxID=1450537 RepID=A0A395HZ73_ASPHC|nr:amino acid transporter [Aspergillus homomorphus CBS 101889]RAL12836.1 amino acid transporter [Aspergillus homomorphus CBS 101889]
MISQPTAVVSEDHGAADLDRAPQYDAALNDKEEKQEDRKGSPIYQDTFGDEEYAEVKYKVLSWWQCGFLMVAETVSLGILSLPAVVGVLGLVPAIILLLGLGLLATYTGYTIGQFRWAYPHIQNMADAGEVLFGSFGREFFGTGQLLLVVFIMASHILTFTVAMNTITEHGTCTIVFGVVGMVISFFLALPRTSANVSYLSVVSFISVFAAVMIVMIAVGIQRPYKGALEVTADTSLYKAFLAVCNIVFSFSGHVAFFGFMSELKDPRDYPKSLCLLQGIDTVLYIVTAVVIYVFAGPNVTSPALGSAGPMIAKIAYGIALPTIIIGGVVNGHVACKFVYVRIFRNSDRMHSRDFVATGSWVVLMLVLWIVAWVIAEAIPVFNDLLSLIASLFASWFTFGFSGMFWLYLNKDRLFSTPSKIALTILNALIVGIAACVCGLGLYVSGRSLHDDANGSSFSCASNA